MLTKILHLLKENQGQLDLIDLSDRLGAQPSAVAGMLEHLVRKGRLVEVQPACGVCETCGVKNQCDLPAKQVKHYTIANRHSTVVPKS